MDHLIFLGSGLISQILYELIISMTTGNVFSWTQSNAWSYQLLTCLFCILYTPQTDDLSSLQDMEVTGHENFDTYQQFSMFVKYCLWALHTLSP